MLRRLSNDWHQFENSGSSRQNTLALATMKLATNNKTMTYLLGPQLLQLSDDVQVVGCQTDTCSVVFCQRRSETNVPDRQRCKPAQEIRQRATMMSLDCL